MGTEWLKMFQSISSITSSQAEYHPPTKTTSDMHEDVHVSQSIKFGSFSILPTRTIPIQSRSGVDSAFLVSIQSVNTHENRFTLEYQHAHEINKIVAICRLTSVSAQSDDLASDVPSSVYRPISLRLVPTRAPSDSFRMFRREYRPLSFSDFISSFTSDVPSTAAPRRLLSTDCVDLTGKMLPDTLTIGS
jgi:hypothetical protein